jgi:hypothetical protein
MPDPNPDPILDPKLMTLPERGLKKVTVLGEVPMLSAAMCNAKWIKWEMFFLISTYERTCNNCLL